MSSIKLRQTSFVTSFHAEHELRGSEIGLDNISGFPLPIPHFRGDRFREEKLRGNDILKLSLLTAQLQRYSSEFWTVSIKEFDRISCLTDKSLTI